MSLLQRLLPTYFIIFFGYIGYSLIITIFTPMFLYKGEGVLPAETPEEIRVLALGLVIFLYPFGQFLSSPILGALSDRIGRRPVLIFSLAFSVVIYALLGVGVWFNSFWMICTLLLIAGLSEGNVTIAQSAIADITPKYERSRFFGYIYLSASLSYIIGPLLGGKLADLPAYPCCTFAIPFFVVSVLLFGVFCWVYLSFKETLKIQNREKVAYFEAFANLKNLFLLKHVRFLFLVNFVLYLAIFGYFQSFPIYIFNTFQTGVWKLAIYIAWSSIPFLIVNLWLTGILAKRFSPLIVAIISAIWTGVFIELFLIPAQEQALWATLFFVGLGAAACLPAIIALLSFTAYEYEQGKAMGINQSLQFFAEAFSGLMVGFLAALFVKLALIIFGLLSLVGAGLLFKKRRDRKDFSLR